MRKKTDGKKESKSLLKDKKRLKWGKKGKCGGSHGSEGVYNKTSSKHGRVAKPYYRAKRENFNEYFAYEILNAIGLSTPKARFIENPETDDVDIIASAIPHFVPLAAYVARWHGTRLMRLTSKVMAVQDQYSFSPYSEIVRDDVHQRMYKLSGNLYASHIGAYLLQDSDLIANGTNLGLAKEGDHFQAYFIDKEFALFTAKHTYDELAKIKIRQAEFIGDDSFKEHTLYVVSNLKKLIETTGSDQNSMLYDIFYNNRTASLYEYYLQEISNRKLRDPFSEYNLAFSIHNSNTNNLGYANPGASTTFARICVEIQEQLKIAYVAPDKPLDNRESITEYLQKLEDRPIETIKEVLKKHTNFSLEDLLREMQFDCSLLQNNETYTVKISDSDIPSFTINKNTSLEEFFIQYYRCCYNFPKPGFTFVNANLYVPYNPNIMHDNIVKNAEVIVAHHANELVAFEEREHIRENIVEQVFAKTENKVDSPHLSIIRSRMLEDLRGPHYLSLFKNQTAITADDASNEDLVHNLYEDNYLELEFDREPIKKQLQDYINRIDPDAGQNPVDFAKDFKFFVSKQTLNRRANFHLATRLLKDLDSGQGIDDLFSPQNLQSIRQEFFKQEGWGAKIKSLNIVGVGIHSTQLNGIIKETRSKYEHLIHTQEQIQASPEFWNK